MTRINKYYDTEFLNQKISAGDHRGAVGGMWEQIGDLQFSYVRTNGLTPDMHFLDVGCGCLRGGLHFIDYLDAGHYYGIDLSQELLDVGYDTELAQAGLTHKLPRKNLYCTETFDATQFDITFDMALALSVFTHLTLNHIKLGLARLGDVIKPGGRFFATVFHCPDGHDWTEPLQHSPGNITTHADIDPYHYCREDLLFCLEGLPWQLERLEAWNHPRNQWMAVFVRTGNTG